MPSDSSKIRKPSGKRRGGAGEKPVSMRSDARRNRERLLEAAVALILAEGGEPSREALAEHAGVGIGTLYRHFPDRQALLHAVVRFAIERSVAAGEAALAEAADGFTALRQYMHAAVDSGIGVVNVIYPLLDKPHPELRARAEALIHTMVDRGRREGHLRSDATAADIVFATIRFSRTLAVGLSPAAESAIAHRQIDIYVDGLRRAAGQPVRKRTGTSKGRER